MRNNSSAYLGQGTPTARPNDGHDPRMDEAVHVPRHLPVSKRDLFTVSDPSARKASPQAKALGIKHGLQ
jgi:hypothetical protein